MGLKCFLLCPDRCSRFDAVWTCLRCLDTLIPVLEHPHRTWIRTAPWTERKSSEDAPLSPTYRRFVSGQITLDMFNAPPAAITCQEILRTIFLSIQIIGQLFILYFFQHVQPYCVKEGLPALPGASHQRLGEAFRGGAPALCVPVPQREGQRRESHHQPVICKGGIQWRQTDVTAGTLHFSRETHCRKDIWPFNR